MKFYFFDDATQFVWISLCETNEYVLVYLFSGPAMPDGGFYSTVEKKMWPGSKDQLL